MEPCRRHQFVATSDVDADWQLGRFDTKFLREALRQRIELPNYSLEVVVSYRLSFHLADEQLVYGFERLLLTEECLEPFGRASRLRRVFAVK